MNLNRKSLFPIILVFLGAILIISSSIWSLQAKLHQSSYTLASSASGLPFPDVHRISLEDAIKAYEQGTAVFLDVRGEPYYSQGHIPGAVSIAEDELLDRLVELDPAVWIITYCT